MLTELTYIKTKDKKVPIYASINVMAEIQKKYGTLDAWMEQLSGTDDEPDITILLESMTMMINEGIEYTNYADNKNEPSMDQKHVGWLVTEISVENATSKVLEAISNGSSGEAPDEEENTETEEKNL